MPGLVWAAFGVAPAGAGAFRRALRRPLADPSASEPGPHLVGPAEVHDDDTVELLRTSYQAGHAIALAGAEAADAELLRGLLGHASGAGWSADIPQVDLVAFRRALRPGGRTHESTSILLPREAVQGLLTDELRARHEARS